MKNDKLPLRLWEAVSEIFDHSAGLVHVADCEVYLAISLEKDRGEKETVPGRCTRDDEDLSGTWMYQNIP